MALTPDFPFVGYTEDGQGGVNFHRTNGPPLYTYGEEADRIKAMLDRYPAQDQRTAMAQPLTPSGAPDDVFAGPDNRTAMNAPDPVPFAPEEQADINAPIPGTEPPKGNVAVGDIQVQKPAYQPVAPPHPDAPLPPMQGVTPEGQTGAMPKRPPINVPPQPEVDPFVHSKGVDPRKLAANGVPVPQSQTTTVEGAAGNPEYAKMIQETTKMRLGAEQQLAGVQQSMAEANIRMQQAAAAEAAAKQQKAIDDLARAQARQQIVEDEHKKRVAVADQEVANQANRSVDQFRAFRGKPGAQIGALLFSVLGGIGQALQRSNQNQALDTIGRVIDNDIASQREEIQAGRVKANNDLARIRDQYGLDREDAEKVTKLAYLKQAEAEAARHAALIGTQQAAQQLAMVQPELQKRQADIVGQMGRDLFQKVSMQTQAKIMQPVAPGGRRKTEAEILHEKAQMAGDREKIAHSEGVIANEGAPLKATGPNGEPQKLSARLGATQAINKSAQEDLINADKHDPGGMIAPPVKIPGTDRYYRTDARISLDTQADAIIGKVIAGNGEPVTEETIHTMRSQLTDPNPAVRKQARARIHEGLRTADKWIEDQRGKSSEGGGGAEVLSGGEQ